MDELMDDLPSIPENLITYHEAFFQFGDEDPICFAYAEHGEFSIILNADLKEEPAIIFNDGKGKEFKIFLKNVFNVKFNLLDITVNFVNF
jgi:hypothetical protein